MNEIRRNLLFQAVLLWFAIALQQGCGEKQAAPEGTPISWHSPRMLEIKKEWDSLFRIETKTMDDYADLSRAMEAVLGKRLSDQDVRQLAASCEMLPINAKERSDFDNAVLNVMVEILVDLADRDSLVKMLSTRCPNYICHYAYIEYNLVFHGYKLKDPILILGEAYSKCRVAEVRYDIASAVRRSFAGLGIRGKDDADFVKNAMQWYEKEKDHLTVNSLYWENELLAPVESYDLHPRFYEKYPGPIPRKPLFEKKPRGE